MKRWEYKIVYASDGSPPSLNRYGEDGWELVLMHAGPHKVCDWIFKRPLPEEPDTRTLADA